MGYFLIIDQIQRGKMKEAKKIHAHGLRLWEKHGCKIIGVWDNWVGGEGFELISIRGFKDFAQYEKMDIAVKKDPEWNDYSESFHTVSTSRTTRLLQPTEYSPLQ
ncbi:NIPSNAP family protein [Chloroflexota bacterium]